MVGAHQRCGFSDQQTTGCSRRDRDRWPWGTSRATTCSTFPTREVGHADDQVEDRFRRQAGDRGMRRFDRDRHPRHQRVDRGTSVAPVEVGTSPPPRRCPCGDRPVHQTRIRRPYAAGRIAPDADQADQDPETRSRDARLKWSEQTVIGPPRAIHQRPANRSLVNPVWSRK